MTIRAQVGDGLGSWWPMEVRRRVVEVVPGDVGVRVRESWAGDMLDVVLREPGWRKVTRRLGYRRGWRAAVMVRVCCELADAPVGKRVRVGWE